MSGFVKAGQVIHYGDNLALQGEKPSGMAGVGQVIWRTAAGVQWKLLASTAVYDTLGLVGTITTPAMDTTGADLLVAVSFVAISTPTDNQGNSWIIGGVGADAPLVAYCVHPITATNHTFSLLGRDHSLIVLAYRFGSGSLAADRSNNRWSGALQTAFSPGSITPSAANSLVLCGVSNSPGNVLSIDSNMTIEVNNPRLVQASATAVASLVQATVANIAPTWSLDTTVAPSYPSVGSTIVSFTPAAPPPPWELLNLASGTNQGVGAAGQLTLTLDTTGATLIVVLAAYSGVTSLFDSLSNTWGSLDATDTIHNRLFYILNPKTSKTHVFTYSLGTDYSSWFFMVFRSSGATVSLDKSSVVNSGGGTTALQLPAITPSAANALILTGVSENCASIVSLDSNFAKQANLQCVAGKSNGGAIASLIQTTPAAISPTWTLGAGGSYSCGTMVSFISS